MINAPINTVWEVLSDFDEYDTWNSYTFNLSLPTDNPTSYIGESFTMDVQITPSKIIKDRKIYLFEYSPDKYKIRWGGRQVGINTDRVQCLEKINNRSSKYINYEDFNGFLGKLPVWVYGRGIKQGMQRVCNELKEYSEK